MQKSTGRASPAVGRPRHAGPSRSPSPRPSYGPAPLPGDAREAVAANLRASAQRLRAMGDVWRAEGWEYAATIAYREALADEQRAAQLEAER